MNAMSNGENSFINGIKLYMLEATNMTENEAYNFAFAILQNKEWLREYLISKDYLVSYGCERTLLWKM